MARSSFYGQQAPSEESEEELLRCRQVDEQYTRRPFYGSRRMVVYLADQQPHGPVVLRRLSGGCVERARQARELQHRSGLAIHGRGRALDNLFVERLWRSLKYEDVYLGWYGTVVELTIGLTQYFAFYHGERAHQALSNRTPNAVYVDATGGGASIPDRFGGATPEKRYSAASEAMDAD